MESRWYNFEPPSGEDHSSLDKLIVKAEQRYSEVGSQLAKYFVEQFSKTKHPIKGLLRQRDIFETQVKPKLAEGKVAYVWVDALRFEWPASSVGCSRMTLSFPSNQPSRLFLRSLRSAWRHCFRRRTNRPRWSLWEAENSGWKLTEWCSRTERTASPS